MRLIQKTIESPVSSGNQRAMLSGYLLDASEVLKVKKRPAVIICPGGAYAFLSQREGEPIATKILAMRCHAFILNYSVSPAKVFPNALMELALSVKLIRSHAAEWNVDVNKIIVMGFSAGGHLAASLGVFWNHTRLCEALRVNAEEIQPNGQVLCYPVISAGKYGHVASIRNLLGADAKDFKKRNLLSLEKQVSEYTPKTFIWHTVTDQSVPVQNSLLFVEALLEHQVNVEMHLYPVGGHGLSLANEETASGKQENIQTECQSWITLLKTWLISNYFEATSI